MKILILFIITLLAPFKYLVTDCLATSSCVSSFDKKPHTVVCIHGFLGSDWNMGFFKKHLIRDGWEVVTWDYHSREATIEAHAQNFVKELNNIAKLHPGCPIYFVAHSMGSLILRTALNHPLCPVEAKTGRIVLLTPLNQSSCFAKELSTFYLGRLLLKDWSGKELSVNENFQYLGKFPESVKVLVIAGCFGWNPFLKEKNDGTLGVTETALTTPYEYVELVVGHAGVLVSKKALRLTKKFLKEERIN